jgi:hypothetical protein
MKSEEPLRTRHEVLVRPIVLLRFPLLQGMAGISGGRCEPYGSPRGVRAEDTNWLKADGYGTLTDYPRRLSL